MNQEQLNGILRVAIPSLCAWAASLGISVFGDSGFVAEATAAAIAIAAMVWSYLAHRNSAKLKMAAAVDPKITIIVPPSVSAKDSSIAAVVADTKVPNVTAGNRPQWLP